MAEVLLYGSINEYSAKDFIKSLDALSDTESLSVRLNSEGGSVDYGWGMVNKFHEFSGEKKVVVDGQAASMGAYFLAYADYAEAYDTSNFVIHRGSYGSWLENSEYFTDALKENLNNVNSSLRKALESKIDVEKLERIKKVTIDEIFSMDDRVDVILTAKEAKTIGLIDKIIKITPSKTAQLNSEMIQVAAKYNFKPDNLLIDANTEDLELNNDSKIMNLTELQAKHPDLYNEVLAKGRTAGVEAEKDRVKSWLEFSEVDAKKASEGIESGKSITMADISAFSLTAIKAQGILDAEDNSENEGTTPPSGEGEANRAEGGASADASNKEIEDFKAKVRANLNIQKKR